MFFSLARFIAGTSEHAIKVQLIADSILVERTNENHHLVITIKPLLVISIVIFLSIHLCWEWYSSFQASWTCSEAVHMPFTDMEAIRSNQQAFAAWSSGGWSEALWCWLAFGTCCPPTCCCWLGGCCCGCCCCPPTCCWFAGCCCQPPCCWFGGCCCQPPCCWFGGCCCQPPCCWFGGCCCQPPCCWFCGCCCQPPCCWFCGCCCQPPCCWFCGCWEWKLSNE